MKKNLLLFLFIAVTFYSKSQCTSAFYDGFESGNYTPTWTLGAGLSSATVNTGSTYAGNFKIVGTGGTSTHLTGLSTAFTSATPNYMSWAIYPTGASATNYVVAGDNAVSATNCMVFCYWINGNAIRFVNSGQYDYTATPSQWYFIELKNINYVTHTFDIYINNTLVMASFGFRSNTVNNLSRVHLYNFNPGTATWDDVKVGNTFSASVLTNSVSCFGGANGSASISVVGGNGPITYTWTSPAVSTTSLAPNLTSGNYSCSVSDGTCSALTSFVINQPTQINVASSQSTINCVNPIGTASVNVTGGVGPYTYTWSPSGGNMSSASSLTAGNYTCSVTDAHSCISTATVAIISNTTSPAISITGSSLICTGQTATLVANGANTYTWNTTANSSSIVISPTISTTYSVSGTNTSNGCVGSNTVTQNVSLCTGINSLVNADPEKMNIYPNPNNGKFTIQFTDNGKYTLINTIGQIIKEINLVESRNNSVEFTGLTSGVYYLIGDRVKIKIIVTN